MTKTVTLSIKDAKGKTGRMEVNLPTGTGQITATNFAEDLAVAVADLINGAITNISITDTIDLPGAIVGFTPNENADVEESAVFIFRTEGNFTTKVSIPTLAEDYVLGGTDVLDLSIAEMDTFVDLMIDGLIDVVNGDAIPSDSRDDDIVSVASAKERFRAS